MNKLHLKGTETDLPSAGHFPRAGPGQSQEPSALSLPFPGVLHQGATRSQRGWFTQRWGTQDFKWWLASQHVPHSESLNPLSEYTHTHIYVLQKVQGKTITLVSKMIRIHALFP